MDTAKPTGPGFLWNKCNILSDIIHQKPSIVYLKHSPQKAEALELQSPVLLEDGGNVSRCVYLEETSHWIRIFEGLLISSFLSHASWLPWGEHPLHRILSTLPFYLTCIQEQESQWLWAEPSEAISWNKLPPLAHLSRGFCGSDSKLAAGGG